MSVLAQDTKDCDDRTSASPWLTCLALSGNLQHVWVKGSEENGLMLVNAVYIHTFQFVIKAQLSRLCIYFHSAPLYLHVAGSWMFHSQNGWVVS